MRKCESAASLAALIFVATACRGTRPVEIGVRDGALTSCPNKPNCVTSGQADPDHKIAAFAVKTSPEDSLKKIKGIVEAMPRTSIVEERVDYLYVEFESMIMRYVDDVEFYAPKGGSEVQVRSASRIGHSDLGVNRKRVEEIRSAYNRP